jgi:hypothetical protein
MASETNEKEDTAPKRASSWSAALAQLPGYPHEEKPKPKLPEVGSGTVREVSWDEDGLQEH